MNSFFSFRKQRRKNDSSCVRPKRGVYRRLYDTEGEDIDSSEDEILHLRNRPDDSANNHIERSIRDGETLASVALRYSCSVAELKRINNLLSDQDFYALSKIKVPVKPFSLLAEIVEQDQEQCDNAAKNENKVHIRTLSIGDSLTSGKAETEQFLQYMDQDLERIRKATCNFKGSLEEVTAELTCKRFHSLPEQTNVPKGTNLCSLLFLMMLVLLVIPIIGFIYIKYHQDNG